MQLFSVFGAIADNVKPYGESMAALRSTFLLSDETQKSDLQDVNIEKSFMNFLSRRLAVNI